MQSIHTHDNDVTTQGITPGFKRYTRIESQMAMTFEKNSAAVSMLTFLHVNNTAMDAGLDSSVCHYTLRKGIVGRLFPWREDAACSDCD